MKVKPKNRKSMILLVLVVVVVVAAASYLGLGTTRSGMRIGYAGNEGLRGWSGNYMLMDGTFRHTIWPKTIPTILHLDVKTEAGTISIEMTDADGAVLFDEENMVTGSFDIAVESHVKVRIDADQHKGGFHIGE